VHESDKWILDEGLSILIIKLFHERWKVLTSVTFSDNHSGPQYQVVVGTYGPILISQYHSFRSWVSRLSYFSELLL